MDDCLTLDLRRWCLRNLCIVCTSLREVPGCSRSVRNLYNYLSLNSSVDVPRHLHNISAYLRGFSHSHSDLFNFVLILLHVYCRSLCNFLSGHHFILGLPKRLRCVLCVDFATNTVFINACLYSKSMIFSSKTHACASDTKTLFYLCGPL